MRPSTWRRCDETADQPDDEQSLHDPQEVMGILAGFDRRPEWMANATLMFDRDVTVGDSRWRVGLRVDFSGDIEAPSPWSWRCRATVSFTPTAELSHQGDVARGEPDWYGDLAARMNDVGYSGRWMMNGAYSWAGFSKDLCGTEEVLAEVERLEVMDIGALLDRNSAMVQCDVLGGDGGVRRDR